jgi:hypothetical protein
VNGTIPIKSFPTLLPPADGSAVSYANLIGILPVDSPMLTLPEAKKSVTPPSEEAIRNKTRLLLDAIGSLRFYPAKTSKSQSLQSTVDALNSRLRKDEIKPPGTISGCLEARSPRCR